MEWVWDWSDGDALVCWAEIFDLWEVMDIITLLHNGRLGSSQGLKVAEGSRLSCKDHDQCGFRPWAGPVGIWR